MAGEKHFSEKYDLVGLQPGRIIDFGTQCNGRTLDLSKATLAQVESLMEQFPVARQYFNEKKSPAPAAASQAGKQRPAPNTRTPESFTK